MIVKILDNWKGAGCWLIKVYIEDYNAEKIIFYEKYAKETSVMKKEFYLKFVEEKKYISKYEVE